MQRTGLTIGTRGSQLALRQTEIVSSLLQQMHPDIRIQVKTIQTDADRFQESPISAFGDKGVFVRAIERALHDRVIDIAVHSLKDVPADVESPGLVLAAFSTRADPRDVFISAKGMAIADMPAGSRIGTSSLRRTVQLRRLRHDLVYTGIRGNVDTRLRKLDRGDYDGIVLAAAGLQRLGLEHRITDYLPVDVCVPDAGQGIMVVQTRKQGEPREAVAGIDDAASRACALAERATVQALGAGCQSPVGALAVLQRGSIHVEAMAASLDGETVHRLWDEGPASAPALVGQRLGQRLLSILSHE
ncbi:MAG: hydroxymethylbilane synthase [Chloroflexota bacterium]